MKVLVIMALSLGAGYFLRASAWGGGRMDLVILVAIAGGILTIPAFVEMIVKSLRRNAEKTEPLQISKVSGYLFATGIIFFFAGVGFAFG